MQKIREKNEIFRAWGHVFDKNIRIHVTFNPEHSPNGMGGAASA